MKSTSDTFAAADATVPGTCMHGAWPAGKLVMYDPLCPAVPRERKKGRFARSLELIL
jgi:hypothetical protein